MTIVVVGLSYLTINKYKRRPSASSSIQLGSSRVELSRVELCATRTRVSSLQMCAFNYSTVASFALETLATCCRCCFYWYRCCCFCCCGRHESSRACGLLIIGILFWRRRRASLAAARARVPMTAVETLVLKTVDSDLLSSAVVFMCRSAGRLDDRVLSMHLTMCNLFLEFDHDSCF